jgi:Na+/melibiose symporter-like transporter
MFGQILIGFSQPFVLAAPTRYSNLWFSDHGRVSATALASLANPLGGALGQLISPIWASHASDIPNMVLYTSILSTVATLPAPFLPKQPPTPPSALAAAPKLSFTEAFATLPRNVSFWMVLVPFSIYVGFFNATSTLINQIFYPYGFSETDAGIAGALLIFVGLGAAAVVSPIVDRTKKYTPVIKVLVPLIAAAYLALIFMPATRSIAGPWAVCALLGATSFSLLPCTLEYLALVTHPVAPEMTSTIVWAAGQLMGAIFIIIMNALKGGWAGEPKQSMERALIFQAVLAWVAVPFALSLGFGRMKKEEGAVGR